MQLSDSHSSYQGYLVGDSHKLERVRTKNQHSSLQISALFQSPWKWRKMCLPGSTYPCLCSILHLRRISGIDMDNQTTGPDFPCSKVRLYIRDVSMLDHQTAAVDSSWLSAYTHEPVDYSWFNSQLNCKRTTILCYTIQPLRDFNHQPNFLVCCCCLPKILAAEKASTVPWYAIYAEYETEDRSVSALRKRCRCRLLVEQDYVVFAVSQQHQTWFLEDVHGAVARCVCNNVNRGL